MGRNQPAGNRSYQSPFTNISYYDHTYFTSLFGEFCYPDGSKPEWIAIDTLQRMFMKWFNQIRLKQVLTFPVETFAMVHNGDDYNRPKLQTTLCRNVCGRALVLYLYFR